MADLQKIQDTLEILVNNDKDTPAVEDDEWTIRLGLINLAIGNWSGDDTLWNELWDTYTHASTVTAATTYDLSLDDYRFPGSKLRLVLPGRQITYVTLVTPDKAQNYINNGRVAYITGNNGGGFVLNFNWIPTVGDDTYGASIVFDYYKVASLLEDPSDVSQMSDTSYITYWAGAQKALLESQNNKYTVFSGLATQSMEQMKIMNTIAPPYQSDTSTDIDALDGSVLGE